MFADNFYNPVKLAMHLLKQKTYICGTLPGDHKGNFKDIVKKKVEESRLCVEKE